MDCKWEMEDNAQILTDECHKEEEYYVDRDHSLYRSSALSLLQPH